MIERDVNVRQNEDAQALQLVLDGNEGFKPLAVDIPTLKAHKDEIVFREAVALVVAGCCGVEACGNPTVALDMKGEHNNPSARNVKGATIKCSNDQSCPLIERPSALLYMPHAPDAAM